MKKMMALVMTCILLLGMLTLPAIAEEKPTLKFLISAGFYDIDSDLGWEVSQRVAGYNIEFEVINDKEQLMLIIASGEPYDYCYLNTETYNLMMNEGALMDITDLLQEKGQNIVEAIPTLWQSTTTDGRIYAIPSTVAQPNSLSNSMMARKDLINAAGIDQMPVTLEGFTQMLEKLKEAYPNMVPLTASKTWIIANIASAFGITGEYQLVNDEIIHVTQHPNFKAYIAYLQELYQKGLLDAEMPAITVEDMRSKWTSSKAVIMYTGWTSSETYTGTLRELNPDMEYAVLPLLEDENGKVHAETKFGVGSYGAIPVTSEHSAEAIEAINNMIQIDNFTEIVLGVEGTHYSIGSDGNYTLIQPAFNDDKTNSNIFVSGFYREDIYPKMWETRLTKNADLEFIFKEYRASLLDGGTPSPVALAPAVTVVDNKGTLDAKVKDTLIAIIANSKDISEVDVLGEYWNQNGGAQIVEFYNTWYKEK